MRSILITGASRGLGFGLSELYLKSGWKVYACVRNTKSDNINNLKANYGDNLVIVEMDVSSDDSVNNAAYVVREHTEKLDMLINDAAVRFKSTNNVLEDVCFEIAAEAFNVNTLGPLRVIKAFVELIRKGDMKVIANISSEAGSIGNCRRQKEFDYCMSKAALNMQSVLLQNYLKKDSIKVLALHPGWVRTDMGGQKAALSVSESAEGIMKVINEHRSDIDGPMYLDYKGEVLKW